MKDISDLKDEIHTLKASIESKGEAMVQLLSRYNHIESAMNAMNEDLASGKMRRLSAEEVMKLEEYDEIKSKLKRLEGDSTKLSTMDADTLKQLKAELQGTIRKVEEAEEDIESQWKCVMCLDNRKNVSFDGCDHMAVCQDCVGDLMPKQCPMCRAPFSTSRVIRI